MYEVRVPIETFMHWACFSYWVRERSEQFTAWVSLKYPEVLDCKWDNNDVVFVFETEEHYNWFLLKQ